MGLAFLDGSFLIAYNSRMDENPYQAPREVQQQIPPRRRWLRKARKPLLMYPLAVVAGAVLIGVPLLGPLAPLDCGGLQMLVGGFLGVVIFHFLF